MDEQTLRVALTDLAEAPAPPSPADPAAIFGKAARARSFRVVAASAVVVAVLGGIATIRFALPETSPPVAGTPLAKATKPIPSAAPVRPPSKPAFAGPYCGWSDTLPGTVEQQLPRIGTWGTAQQVSGLCEASLGAFLPVTVRGLTGTVQVVVSQGNKMAPRSDACMGNMHCQQTANGYVGWEDDHVQPSIGQTATAMHVAEARYATNSGLLFDIEATNEMLDYGEDLTAPPAYPPMATAPYNGQQLRDLALTLSQVNWFGNH